MKMRRYRCESYQIQETFSQQCKMEGTYLVRYQVQDSDDGLG
jgi:hypothetical protein